MVSGVVGWAQLLNEKGAEVMRTAKAAKRRRLWVPLLTGFPLSLRFQGRYVLWHGGLPMPRIVNRGGELHSGGCSLWSGVRLEVGKGAVLSIGKGSYLNRNTTVVCHERVTIGRAVKISWDVVVMDTDEHDLPGSRGRTAAVTIGDEVWVGCRAIILKGVTIGRGAVIGAGAIVTSDIPEYTLAVGQPARVIRELR